MTGAEEEIVGIRYQAMVSEDELRRLSMCCYKN
jgi:hypothetical protein